ncbi:thymidine kinase [Raineyella antarctica]|uniref:Thymidine kinase n=1 Tax=Raineyella antarctica TaxID=1577474 RepID=A0A1G6GQ45_9ACTN|nr:thymidine kinase [Raineyella antarctica]SDB84078.1 thymidine kinase [Raineyella antarctica]
MAELVFFTGVMESGKSTLALQLDHTMTAGGRRGAVFTCDDRSGRPIVTSRLGLAREAVEVTDDFDFWHHVIGSLTRGDRVEYLICDEAQFYRPGHVDQLARIVDDLAIDVYAFGLLTDFRTRIFPGSRRLVELADRIETLQVTPLCWCGAKGTTNTRTLDGYIVTEGDQKVVGDVALEGTDSADGGSIAYEVLCRKHHRNGITRKVVALGSAPEPLPFAPDQDALTPAGRPSGLPSSVPGASASARQASVPTQQRG